MAATLVSGGIQGIFKGISGLVTSNSDDQSFRNGWTQDQVGQVSAANPKKNIMIVYPPHTENFTGSQYKQLICKTPKQTLSYDCYIFDAGDFTLKGDGGYLNWAFAGNFTRNKNTVTFKAIGS